MKKSLIRQSSILVTLALLAMIYFNCDDSAVNTNTNNSFIISGKISGWTSGAKTLSAHITSISGHNYEIATCPIDAEGNFSLTLPATISDTSLYSGDSVFSMGCTGSVIVTPSNAKGSKMWRFNVMDGSNVIGFIRFCNYDMLSAGAFEYVYLWVNQDLSVSGKQYCIGDTIKYSGTAKSGWNIVYENYVSKFSTYGYVIEYNNIQPSGGVWKYISY